MQSPAIMKPDASWAARIVRDVASCAFILGGVGFLSGFFGPLALSPDANQGPLLGILITGPGGAVLGALLGAVTGVLAISPHAYRMVLAVSCTLMAGTTLFFSTPQPEHRTEIVDALIGGCAPLSSRREKTLAYWDEALARTNYSQPRAGWKDDFDRMLAHESAVVLELHVIRQSSVYENRKPWNRGTLDARPWNTSTHVQSYFAKYDGGSCASYPIGTKQLFVTSGETSHQWPPEILANLLDLATVEPAPEKYQRLVGE
jgi:hypothetical protein